jgi:hypothetical protein
MGFEPSQKLRDAAMLKRTGRRDERRPVNTDDDAKKAAAPMTKHAFPGHCKSPISRCERRRWRPDAYVAGGGHG